jgi:hypothetical protein
MIEARGVRGGQTVNEPLADPPLDRHVPIEISPEAGVQPACNTQFEFDLSHASHLDKFAISQHAGDASRKRSDSGSAGLDWGWI